MAAENPLAKEDRIRKFSKAEFMDEFRAAATDQAKLERLIAEAEHLPANAWAKALLWAAASGHAEFIVQFSARAPPAMQNLLRTARDGDGFTALHRAVVAGKRQVVDLLTRGGPETSPAERFEALQARTPEGWTALHLAVVCADDDAVGLLLEGYGSAEAPAETEWDMADNAWTTPLHYAALGNRLAAMDQLLQRPSYARHANARDFYMRTPLHMAQTQEAIQTLVECAAVDVNAVDCCLFSPLHWFVFAGATDSVRCLLSLADRRTVRTTEEDVQGRPVFQIAVENWSLDPKVRKDIAKLLCTSAGVKDDIEMMYRDRQVYVDAANAILVGAALIASVTFGGWLQPPSGDDLWQSRHDKRVFWAANSLSFFFSIATVVCGAGAVLPMENVYIGRTVRSIRRALALTSTLLMMSVVFVLVAFAASGFVAQSDLVGLKRNMAVTTGVGGAVCAVVLAWFLLRLYRLAPDPMRVLRVFKEWRKTMARRSNGRDLEEIRKVLDEAEDRAWKELERKHRRQGGAALERRRLDLLDLVLALGRASEKAAEAGRQGRLARVKGSCEKGLRVDAPEKEGLWSRWIHGHVREEVLEQQILAFQEAYEQARLPRGQTGQTQNPTVNMLVLSHVSELGLQYWVDGFSVPHCRANTRGREMQRWIRIHDRVLLQKVPQLSNECDMFEYGLLAFDDWAV